MFSAVCAAQTAHIGACPLALALHSVGLLGFSQGATAAALLLAHLARHQQEQACDDEQSLSSDALFTPKCAILVSWVGSYGSRNNNVQE
jgi:hypothetical protein